MATDTWWVWLTRQVGTDVQVEVARAIGMEQSAASRWQRGKNLPRPEKAIAIARIIGRPPVEALVAAGYLDAKEAAASVELRTGLDQAPDDELLGEIRARMRGARHAQESEQGEGRAASGGSGGKGSGRRTSIAAAADHGEFQPALPPHVGAAMDWESAIREVQQSSDLSDEDKLTTTNAIARMRDRALSPDRESVSGEASTR